MKLNKLRDQLRKAQRARPEAFVVPDDDETLNCLACHGTGLEPWGLEALKDPDASRHRAQCKHCGGTGLRLAGEKAPPQASKTNKLTTRTTEALTSAIHGAIAKRIGGLRVTLVSEHPGDLRAAPTLDHLDPDTVLTSHAIVTGLAATATSLKAEAVRFTPSMFHEDKRGYPIVAAVVSSEKTILGVIDLARGGIGIIQTLDDVLIGVDLELSK
jgi:hypothetical protein